MNARQRSALEFAAGRTEPFYAFLLADHLHSKGLATRHASSTMWGVDAHQRDSQGAANTLKALKRRGLVVNDGGGCYVQAMWRITDAGRAALRDFQ